MSLLWLPDSPGKVTSPRVPLGILQAWYLDRGITQVCAVELSLVSCSRITWICIVYTYMCMHNATFFIEGTWYIKGCLHLRLANFDARFQLSNPCCCVLIHIYKSLWAVVYQLSIDEWNWAIHRNTSCMSSTSTSNVLVMMSSVYMNMCHTLCIVVYQRSTDRTDWKTDVF